MHRALLDSGLKPANYVVFPGGGGGVGIQGVQLAKIMGMRAIVIDGGDAKGKLAMEMGAEEFIDFTKVSDVAAEVKRICGGVGAHGVIVTAYQAYKGERFPLQTTCTQRWTNANKDAVSFIGDRVSGVIMAVALRKLKPLSASRNALKTDVRAAPAGLITLGTDPNFFSLRNLTIKGTIIGTMQDTAATLEYARRGLLKQICEVRGLSAFADSVQELRQGKVVGRVVIDFNKE